MFNRELESPLDIAQNLAMDSAAKKKQALGYILEEMERSSPSDVFSVKSDEEDLWSKKSSKFKNFDPTKHFTFVNFMFSTYNFIILQQF